jgi:RHS repeat-associated protein
MRRDNVLYYIAGDHLGTTSVVLDALGDKVAESRHLPYGGERWSSGTLPMDYRFTGQRFEQPLGIYIMGARWYDPALGRWLSADTIVPEPMDPQAFNRYSFVVGNPLKYIDPSGHWYYDPGCDCLVSEGVRDSGVNDYPDYLKIGEPERCEGTLAECFGDLEDGLRPEGTERLAEFAHRQLIDEDELNELLEVVYEDLEKERMVPAGLNLLGVLAGRDRYDTPFWNGDGNDTIVCIGDYSSCYRRSHVNYVAQGMWGAAAGETLEETLQVAETWNQTIYQHPPEPAELFWTAFGWRWYRQRQMQENRKQE